MPQHSTDAPGDEANPDTAFTRKMQRLLSAMRMTAYSLAVLFMLAMSVRGVWVTRNQMEAEAERSIQSAAAAVAAMGEAETLDPAMAGAMFEALAPKAVTLRLDDGQDDRKSGVDPQRIALSNGRGTLVAQVDHRAIWQAALRTNIAYMLFILALGLPVIAIFLYMGWLVNRPALRLLMFAQAEGEHDQAPPKLPTIWTSVLERLKQQKASQAQMQAFIDNAPFTMFVTDLHGRFVVTDTQPAEQFKPRHELGEYSTPEWTAVTQEMDERILASGEMQQRESAFDASSGVRHISMTRFPIRSPEGDIVMIGSILRDISEQRKTEAALAEQQAQRHQSEKLGALGQLLAGVAHELNNPLAAVIGQTALLAEDLEGTEHAERTSKIRRAADRCARIVQSFLAMARQKAPEYRLVNINDQVRSAIELTEYQLRAAQVTLDLQLDAKLPKTEADPDQLHQVIANLLNNARQALEEVSGERKITVTSSHKRGKIRITVADTGRGIDAETRKRMFDPFFTTKAVGSGTGIGLSFSLGIIEAHAGTISIEDAAVGSVFVITLPVKNNGADITAPESPLATPSQGRALVIDDEADVAETLADMLKRQGLDVTIAIGGLAGQATMASGAKFDLVLSDIRMPDLDGPALFAWMGASRPDLIGNIAFVTGDTLSLVVADFLKSVACPVLEKPFTTQALRELVAAMLGSRLGDPK